MEVLSFEAKKMRKQSDIAALFKRSLSRWIPLSVHFICCPHNPLTCYWSKFNACWFSDVEQSESDDALLARYIVNSTTKLLSPHSLVYRAGHGANGSEPCAVASLLKCTWGRMFSRQPSWRWPARR